VAKAAILVARLFRCWSHGSRRRLVVRQRPRRMKLVDHHVSDKGVLFTTYEPAGEVETGSFATKEPSRAELELREKIREGAW